MKILSAILLLLILFLTVQPVFANKILLKGTSVADKCCSEKHSKQSPKESDNNCCNGGQCDNPFLSCSDCCFINLDKSVFTVANIFKQNKKIRLINDKVLSSYIDDVWHPPQQV